MTAKKTSAPAMEIPETLKASAATYFERLSEGHENLTSAFETARARSTRVADQLFANVVAGQREMLALGQAMAKDPMAYNKHLEAAMESVTGAQARTLELAKILYREQVEATAELRGAAERSFAAAQRFVPPMEKFTNLFTAAAK